MKTTTIKATSRISTKIGDTFYTFEYCEERSVEDVEGDALEDARADLWETCHGEVDTQVEDVVKLLKR